MKALALLSGVLVALLPFVALYRVVAREEKKIAATATAEMWDRTIDDYTQHLDTTMPPAMTGRRHQESRIAGLAATTNNTRSMWD